MGSLENGIIRRKYQLDLPFLERWPAHLVMVRPSFFARFHFPSACQGY